MKAAPKDIADPAVAIEIYQDHLDVVSDLLFRGEGEACARYFASPLLIRTTETETLIETHEDLVKDVIQHHETLKGHGVTHYVRIAKRARMMAPTLVEGWHETFILRNATTVMPSYLSRVFLRFEDDLWKIAEAEHELSNQRYPLHHVTPNPGAFSERWGQGVVDIRAAGVPAQTLYQEQLDAMTRAQNAHDFEGWCAHFAYPYMSHYDEADQVITEPEDARPFFSLGAEILSQPGARVARIASRAEFISSDRICGYHDAIITKDDETIFGPVKCRMVLILLDGAWKCNSVTNSLSNTGIPRDMFQVSDVLPTMRSIEERMRK